MPDWPERHVKGVPGRIANDVWRTWLHEAVRHSRDTAERWAPIAMSDKQLAGYLWLRNSAVGNGTMSRARLLAHCSAAIRPRPDVKARAYNLVLELEGKEAYGRGAEVWEVANVMMFLASDYSSYMTGEILAVSAQRA